MYKLDRVTFSVPFGCHSGMESHFGLHLYLTYNSTPFHSTQVVLSENRVTGHCDVQIGPEKGTQSSI